MAKDKGQADEGESLVDYQARRQREAYEANALPPDPGQEFQRLSSKMGRETLEMPKANEPGPMTKLAVEPPTEKSVVGHSDEKKAKLAKNKKPSSRKARKGDK